MTDNDIMKAYEACFLGMDGCGECPFHEDDECGATHGSRLAELAFDLMNRRQAQIEKLEAVERRLSEEILHKRSKIARLAYELEGLKKFIEEDQGLILKLTNVPKDEYDNQIKTEALKEFAEAVYYHISSYFTDADGDVVMKLKELRTVLNIKLAEATEVNEDELAEKALKELKGGAE